MKINNEPGKALALPGKEREEYIMKRKIVSLILAELMVIVFVGCGSQETTELPSTNLSIKSSVCTDFYVGQGPFISFVTIIRFHEDETLEWLDVTGIDNGIFKYGPMKYGFYDLDGEKMRINISGYENEIICVVLDNAEEIIIDGESFLHTNDIKDETRSKFSETSA